MVEVIRGIDLGFLIAFVVAFSMLMCSAVLSNIEIPKLLEATFQNFAAGLILAAVAAELFPLMLTGVSKGDTFSGVTVGFLIGLGLVYGLEPAIESVTSCFVSDSTDLKTRLSEVVGVEGNLSLGAIEQAKGSAPQHPDISKRSSLLRRSSMLRRSTASRHSKRIDKDGDGDGYLPIDLIFAVVLDCFVDGFLIGVTCALQPTAGVTLGVANILEMGFLGMAYAGSMKKAVKSTALWRTLALYIPPLVMGLSGGLGAFLANLSYKEPAVYVGFVAFGVVALLSLVCGELILEAKETQDEVTKETEQDTWFVSASLFAGIYVVLMLARVV